MSPALPRAPAGGSARDLQALMSTFFGKTLGPDSVAAATDDDPEGCCPTCLEPFDAAAEPPVFTRCGHRFHLQCLYAWLERKQTCPLCDSAIDIEGEEEDGGEEE